LSMVGEAPRDEGKKSLVRRRHVFFFAGFDPKGASFYHHLYRQEAGKQAAVAGYDIQVGGRLKTPGSNDSWQVQLEQGGALCESVIEHVRWDDLVRAHWPRRAAPLLLDMVRSYAYALRCGVIPAVWRIAPKTLVPWLYPLAFVLVTTLLGAGVAALAGAWLLRAGLGAWTLALLLPVVGVATFRAALRLEERLNTTWLARIFRFASQQARGEIAGLEARLDGAAASIAERLRAPEVDEVLVVGFSVGSILAASATARALELAPGAPARLSLLTLGQCIPMLGLLPEATGFRRELATLADAKALVWVDFSSTTDWGSFARVDPLLACIPGLGAHGKPGAGANRRWRSPRFYQLFDALDYVRIRRDKRRMHVQYLMAGDRVGEYDYFAMTAGVAPLSARLH
jgi:hypothetical protein